MVRFATIWGHQLRDGARGMGSPLGPILGESQVQLKSRDNAKNERTEVWLRLEASVIAVCVVTSYAFALWGIFHG